MEIRNQEYGARSWGRVPRAYHDIVRPESESDVVQAFDRLKVSEREMLPWGLGRSYGDSNVNADGSLLEMRRLDRFVGLDKTSRILRAEAGVSLDEILRLIVPHGLFLPTNPGTRFVTLGGAIANDVHGKNHHRAGSFGCHVRRMSLMRSNQEVMELSRTSNPAMFYATIGGMGLTGVILEAEIDLVSISSSLISQKLEPVRNVDHFFDIASHRALEHEHTVAWIDCTATGDKIGQGVFSSGDWSIDGDLKGHERDAGLKVPFDIPSVALNPLTLRLFNHAYRWRQLSRPRFSQVDYSSFFFPLDSIRDWNRLYGRAGFFQYQSVVPAEHGREATREMLKIISRSGQGSFLAVLKTFGDKGSGGMLSFPRAGVTLAMDFANSGAKYHRLADELDRVVQDAHGRLYPAKDGRMSGAMFRTGYPAFEAFCRFKDPLLSSSFWRRVSQ